jgi:predicted transcriptional regulator
MTRLPDHTVVLNVSALQALQRHRFSKFDTLVLWTLVANIPVTGDVVVHSELEKNLSLSHSTVSTAIRRLRETGFLVRGVKSGVSYHYKLNPVYFRLL